MTTKKGRDAIHAATGMLAPHGGCGASTSVLIPVQAHSGSTPTRFLTPAQAPGSDSATTAVPVAEHSVLPEYSMAQYGGKHGTCDSVMCTAVLLDVFLDMGHVPHVTA